MNYPTDFNIKTASKDYNKFDMSKTHITTQDFGIMKPLECKLCFPGDKINLSVTQETKILTMPAPTFGRCDMILRAFYVPINNIWKDFNDYISNQKIPTSTAQLLSPDVPFMYAGDIMRLFYELDPIFGAQDAFVVEGEGEDFDLVFHVIDVDSDEVSSYYRNRKFTFLGKKLYDFFVSIGLKLPTCVALTNGYGFIGENDNFNIINNSVEEMPDEVRSSWSYASQKISLLPLMAWWKFYLDWVVPARFLSNYTYIRYILEHKEPRNLSFYDLSQLLRAIPVSFLEDDFFTTAFSSPFGYEDSANVANNGITINNPADGTSPHFQGATVRTSPNVGALVKTAEDDTAINMFTLRSLGALQDMVNRGKIAGSKIKDYLEATYGIRASDDALHISSYLGSQRIPIEFSAIQTQTDTYNEDNGQGMLAGQYVGKANVGNAPFNISLEVKDKMHGFFFVTTELQVKTSYTQALAPEFLALDRLDFYDGAFEHGVEAIPRMLLANIDYKPNEDSLYEFLNQSVSPQDIFGWCQTYAKYKVNFDNVSGDFVINSLNTGLDSWYLTRLFTLENLAKDYPMINEKFLQAISDDTNEGYDRIFSVANTSIDHFRSIFHIDLKMMRRMKSLRDSLEFEDGGDTITKSINNSIQS